MSWSDPERLRKMEAEAIARPQDPIFAASLERIERMAVSGDPADELMGRLMQACTPVLKDWQARIESCDVPGTVAGSVGITDAFASMFGNVLTAMPPASRPQLKSRFDKMLASTMRGIEDMLEKSRRS